MKPDGLGDFSRDVCFPSSVGKCFDQLTHSAIQEPVTTAGPATFTCNHEDCTSQAIHFLYEEALALHMRIKHGLSLSGRPIQPDLPFTCKLPFCQLKDRDWMNRSELVRHMRIYQGMHVTALTGKLNLA